MSREAVGTRNSILAICVVLSLVTPPLFGQAVSNPNQIEGVIEFTNTDATILSVLQPPSHQGFHQAHVTARSTTSPPLYNLTFATASSRTRGEYSITVEAGPPNEGISYDTQILMFLQPFKSPHFDYYYFTRAISDSVEEVPAAPVTVNFSECAGLLDIRWKDSEGNPVSVDGGTVYAYRETSPDSDVFSTQARATLAAGSVQEYLAVRGDGSLYRVDVSYELGTDPWSDRVRHFHREFVNVACDQIVEITYIVPEEGGGSFGKMTGNVDILGEDESRITDVTLMRADSGPSGNYRFDTVDVFPSEGTFELENLVPSTSVEPPVDYRVFGDLFIRSGFRAEYFRTPFLTDQNGRVEVVAGETKDLGDTFVIDPGYVAGEMMLAGPSSDLGSPCLEDLRRVSDLANRNQVITDRYSMGGSYIEAVGDSTPAVGAELSAEGGLAQVLFEGGFETTSDTFEGDYELVLGGLRGEASVWTVPNLSLSFLDTATPAAPGTYQSSSMTLIDQNPEALEIVPGETHDRPISRCFGQLNLSFVSPLNDIYDPRILGNGRFVGPDLEGEHTDYRVEFEAYGTPTTYPEASSDGLVTACLPEGTYDFEPYASSIDEAGDTTFTQLPPLRGLQIGCRQITNVTLGHQVTLDLDSECSTESPMTITGSASSTGTVPVQIEEIFATVNGDPVVPDCTSCQDANFDFTVDLDACDNQVTVAARDEFDRLASTTATIRLDGTNPALTECADVVIDSAPGQPGAVVHFPISSADDCDGDLPVVCDPPSGSFFTSGSHEVTCRAEDMCRNEAACSFTVTVGAETAQPFGCINGRAVVARDESTLLSAVDFDGTGAFGLSSLGGAPGIEYNNLGFRRRDGFLYAVELDGAGNVQLVRIDAIGGVTGLGRPPGLPTDQRFDAGDVSPDGRWLFAYASDQAAYTVDLEQWQAFPLTISGDSGNVRDWAYHPEDGRLYGCDGTGGQLAILDPVGLRTDHEVSTSSGTGLPTGEAYGAAWFEDGHLFCYRNQSGQIYEIDPAGPSLVGVTSGEGTERNDGAACSQSVLGAAVRMSSGGAELPETVTLEYVFENTSINDVASQLLAEADLRAVFGEHGLDWTFGSIASVPSSFANATFDGHSNLGLIETFQDLAAGEVATITVEIELLTLDHARSTGDFCTQTLVTGRDAGGLPVGDLSTSGLDPDPDGDGRPEERGLSCAKLGQVPFICADEAMMVRDLDASIDVIDQSGSAFTFGSVGGLTGRELNNLGYRVTDSLLYAVELTPNGNRGLVQIDATGTVNDLGQPWGLPSNVRFDAGDISPDGEWMYITATNKPLYAVDLTSSPLQASSVAVTGAVGLVFDWAVHPVDDRLYGGDMTHGQLAILDPSGHRNDVPLAGLPRGIPYGGAWFDASGRLFLYRNSGEIYEIDLEGPTVVSVKSGPASLRNDAARCVAP